MNNFFVKLGHSLLEFVSYILNITTLNEEKVKDFL